jgi:hypothetical protein
MFITITKFNLLICLLASMLYIKPVVLLSSNQISFFPDEKAAVEKLKIDPTEDSAKELAEIRFKYATELYVYAKKNNDWDAFELALLYASSVTELNPTEWVYWLLLGKIYSEIEGEGVVLALDPLKNAIKLHPNSFEAHSLLDLLFPNW